MNDMGEVGWYVEPVEQTHTLNEVASYSLDISRHILGILGNDAELTRKAMAVSMYLNGMIVQGMVDRRLS